MKNPARRFAGYGGCSQSVLFHSEKYPERLFDPEEVRRSFDAQFKVESLG
jgi:hypothetical protein